MIRIFVPAPGLVSRLIRPPKRLVTMLWTMCNPRPVLPWSRRVVKNGSNTWRLTSGLMPQPSSENSTSTLCLPDACAAIWTASACAVRKGVHRGIDNQIGEHLAVRSGIAVHGEIGLAFDADHKISAQPVPQSFDDLLERLYQVDRVTEIDHDLRCRLPA